MADDTGGRVRQPTLGPFDPNRGSSCQGAHCPMRTFFRTLAATAVLTALVLGTAASTVLAASPSGTPATVARYDYDGAWCFDYGTSYDCSVVDATLAVTTTPDGRDIARINFRMVVNSFDPSGVQIGSSRTVAFDRTVFADGGQDGTFPGWDLQRHPHARGRRLRHLRVDIPLQGRGLRAAIREVRRPRLRLTPRSAQGRSPNLAAAPARPARSGSSC